MELSAGRNARILGRTWERPSDKELRHRLYEKRPDLRDGLHAHTIQGVLDGMNDAVATYRENRRQAIWMCTPRIGRRTIVHWTSRRDTDGVPPTMANVSR
mgnify:CR=1 FL=1